MAVLDDAGPGGDPGPAFHLFEVIFRIQPRDPWLDGSQGCRHARGPGDRRGDTDRSATGPLAQGACGAGTFQHDPFTVGPSADGTCGTGTRIDDNSHAMGRCASRAFGAFGSAFGRHRGRDRGRDGTGFSCAVGPFAGHATGAAAIRPFAGRAGGAHGEHGRGYARFPSADLSWGAKARIDIDPRAIGRRPDHAIRAVTVGRCSYRTLGAVPLAIRPPALAVWAAGRVRHTVGRCAVSSIGTGIGRRNIR